MTDDGLLTSSIHHLTRLGVGAVLAVVLLASGCTYYSFTGATIPSDIETIAIPLVDDRSNSPFVAIDQDLTDLLIERFVDQTRLSLTTRTAEADAVLDVRIDGYSSQPTTVGGDDRATANRVTINVQVEYLDQVNDESFLSRAFTGQSNYDPAEGLGGQEEASAIALEELADDIFTQATSDW